MAEEKPAAPQEQKPKPKLPLKTIIIIIGVLLLEGATISVFTVFGGESQSADATDPIESTVDTETETMAEVLLAKDFSVDNYVGGRTRLIVNMEVSAKVDKANQEKLTVLIEEHGTEIKDSIRTLVSSAEPTQIKDPKLEVMKREIKIGVEKIIGEGLIEEILVPHWQSHSVD